MYAAINDMSQDEDLLGRVRACAALEGIPSVEYWVQQRRWLIVARADWADAYAYAQNTGNAAPGRDSGVITDQMILSAVQAVREMP